MKLKKIGLLAVVFTLFAATLAVAQPPLRSQVTLQNPGFSEKFKFYIEVYARADERSRSFELGSTHLSIRFNSAVLSISDPAAALSEQHPAFHANANYEAMRLSTEGPGLATLSIEPRNRSGEVLPYREIRLARITFDVSEETYRTVRSGFDLLQASTMVTIDGVRVFMSRDGLPVQGMICNPIIGDISSPMTAVVDELFVFAPEAHACINAGPLTFAYQGLPAWSVFDPNSGRVNGTAPSFSMGDAYPVTLRVTDAYMDSAERAFVIQVECASGPLLLSGDPITSIAAGAFYDFRPTVANGCGQLTFSVSNLPGWADFDPSTGRLSGTPSAADAGTTPIITIRVEDQTGDYDSLSFAIEVTLTCSAPILSGSPPAAVMVDTFYTFTPTVQFGCPPLTFTIENRPDWADFDPSTGRLSGTPSAAGAGTTPTITIRVEDRIGDYDTLSFAIDVIWVCSEPVLSGAPPQSLTAGSPYLFTPTVTNGCPPLAFAIQNKPEWADFDENDGTLSGAPPDTYVGRHSDIVITVTDANGDSSTLGPFDITVTAGSGGGSRSGCFISTLIRQTRSR